ncbi:MAG: class I SAM-dependent methyltransferase [Candidatus Krumholzibacteriota bacterium]|nr:class I SAM-dependent methyltransferase [Candidatus Krumholzibacteriota bacterium]
MNNGKEGGSFRDPRGFIFFSQGRLYRQVNAGYRDEYDRLIKSGLYEELVTSGLLVEHEEVDPSLAGSGQAFKVLRPRMIPFVSYPHEWSFSQLQDAALATLAIQKLALEKGMSLKDCSAFNIQFEGCTPVFIDTLSFEIYRKGEPWVAYRQFCQHFLAPLALMSFRDVRLNQLFRVYIDGIPLDLASSLLPLRTRFSFSLLTHIHLHARYQRRYQGETEKPRIRKSMSLNSLRGMIDNLETAVKGMRWAPRGTEWAEYYQDTNYSPEGLDIKERLLGEFLEGVSPGTVWDLGANTGRFSRVAVQKGHYVISFDIDPAAVERNYLQGRAQRSKNLLPLLLDLTNPSSGMGWGGEERMSLSRRGPADTALALALIHHLAISNNLPFERIAGYLSGICDSLVIEFVPKEDSQVRRLLVCREDIFDDYAQDKFEEAFSRYFQIERSEKILDSLRTLYLMRKRG